MSLQMSSCVCIPYIKSCSSKGLSGPSTIFGFFLARHKTVMGVVLYMYLKYSTDYIDSKYIWVHRSNSLGFFVAEIPFLTFFPFTLEKEQVWSSGTQKMLLPE